MSGTVARWTWAASAPARWALVALIRVYRLTLSGMLGGQCRFHPSCSVYAEQVVRGQGAIRGVALAGWRILRCQPFSPGGVDLPPAPRHPGRDAVEAQATDVYEDVIRHPVSGARP